MGCGKGGLGWGSALQGTAPWAVSKLSLGSDSPTTGGITILGSGAVCALPLM